MPELKASTTAPDPRVMVPPAVLAAQQRAEELQRQAIQAAQQEAEQQAQAAQETQGETLAPPVPNGQEPLYQPPQPQPQPQAQESQAQEPQGGEHAGAEASPDQRFRSEQGRRKRLEEQLRAANAENQQMRLTMAQLQAQMNQLQAQPPAQQGGSDLRFGQAPTSSLMPRLTPEEIADYGEDFINVVKKAAADAVAGEIADVKQRLTGVAGHVQATAQQTMHDYLSSRVPNWVQLNENPDFLNWAGHVDPFSGQVRLDMLREAYTRNDAARVAAFFEGFQREAAVLAPRAAEPGNGRAPAPKPTLDQFVAPGRARPAARPEPTPGAPPMIRRSDISQFYTDVAAGKYRGRDADRESYERAIFAAQAAGRII